MGQEGLLRHKMCWTAAGMAATTAGMALSLLALPAHLVRVQRREHLQGMKGRGVGQEGCSREMHAHAPSTVWDAHSQSSRLTSGSALRRGRGPDPATSSAQ